MAKQHNYRVLWLSLALIGVALWALRRPSQTPPLAEPSRNAGNRTVPETIPDFKEWLSSPSRDLAEGIELAKVRAAYMDRLIRSNPEQAIQEGLSLSEWSSLPHEIQALVEQPFSALANVDVMIACSETSSRTGITTEFSDAARMETFVYGRREAIRSKTGLPVQGIRLGNIGVLREEIFQALSGADESIALQWFPVALPDPGGDAVAALAGGRIFYFKDRAALDDANRRLAALEEMPGPGAGPQGLFSALDAYLTEAGGIDFPALLLRAERAASAWTGTPRDMYVIMVDFSDLPGQPTDPVALSNTINTTVSQQIWDMSYEKTHIVGTVNTNTYRVSGLSTSYIDTLNTFPNAIALQEEAKALAVSDGVDLSPYETVCVFFTHISGMGFSGLGTVGGPRLWLNGSTSAQTITHELGHNYGSQHANSWNTPSGNPVDPSGSEINYGDFTDIMGSGSVPSGHFNAMHKKIVGWLDAQNWQSVNTSGTYRVYRSDHRQTTGLLRGLEIQKGGGDQYWVGLRQEQTGYEFFSRGAYVLWKQAGDNESDLLDMSPQSAGGKQDGGLALGQTYSDTAAQVHITPTARGGQTPNEWMDITVNLGAFSGNGAPAASLSGPTQLVYQASAVFSVAASDPDGDPLSYFWDTGDGLVKQNAPTIVATWLSGSTATVSCVVSDMKGGTHTVSQTVILSSPLESWTPHTSGTTADLNDIAYGNGRLVVVGRDWQTLWSENGVDWTVYNFPYPFSPYLYGVVFDGAKFIAAGFDFASGSGEGAIFTSPDGASWTRRFIGGEFLNDVAYGGGTYVAVGDKGTILRSTDGISWSTNASGTATDLSGISYGDGVFVAVGPQWSGNSSIALVSSDGLSWTNHSAGIDLASWKLLRDVQYCNNQFLGGGFFARILNSTDQGQSFTTTMTGDRYSIPAFAYGDGTYFAAGINTNNDLADINLISLDGVNWTALSTVSQNNRNAAVFYNGTFITVGDGGSIWQSAPAGASATGFANWQLQNGATLGLNRDPLEDADFDGRVNLEEYARGSSATDAGSVPAAGVESFSGSYFTLSYARNGMKPDIEYRVERSTNLLTNQWGTAGTVIVEDSATNLTVRSAYTMASQTNEFMQLKVQLK